METMIVSIGFFLQLVAESDVQSADDKKHDDNADEE